MSLLGLKSLYVRQALCQAGFGRGRFLGRFGPLDNQQQLW
jgi:hypothetical protein